MKASGILDGLKSNLRQKLYDQLKLKNEKAGINYRDQSNRLSFKIAVSMIADFMTKCDMPYAQSVFLPESGISQEILTKGELVELLRLGHDDMIQGRKDSTPLIIDIVDQVKSSGTIRPNMTSCYIQTEEAGEAGMNLDQKLKKIDYTLMEKLEVERVMPYKSMEEKLLKHKRELEAKYKEDLESEIRRLKEFEVSKMRMEEAQKYRQKLHEQRNELEELHIQNIKELKLRETEAWERIKNKERDIEKVSYEHRQKVLKDEEINRYRENEVKKTVEMELYLVKQEREKISKMEKEYELKIKELDAFKMKLDKEKTEDFSRYKSDFMREQKDTDFDLHRRKLQVEEDEARIKHEKQRLQMIENKNVNLGKDLEEQTREFKDLKKVHDKMSKELQDLKDQYRVVNENLKREIEVIKSRDMENKALYNENQSLKERIDDYKHTNQSIKEDQGSLIENLKVQLNATRDMLDKMKENKDREQRKLKERYEDERRRETEQYQLEYEKLKGEISILQKRLGQEETYSKELAVINNKLTNNISSIKDKTVTKEYEYHTYVKHQPDYYQEDSDETDELMKKKRQWAELEKEQQEVKRNIKSLMKMAPESRVMDDPMLADRVRGVRYEPQRYNEPEIKEIEKKVSLEKPKHSQEKMISPEKPKSSQTKPQSAVVGSSQQHKEEVKKPNQSNETPTSGRNYESQKRAWTTGVNEKPKVEEKPKLEDIKPSVYKQPFEQQPAPSSALTSGAQKKSGGLLNKGPFAKKTGGSGNQGGVQNITTEKSDPSAVIQDTYEDILKPKEKQNDFMVSDEKQSDSNIYEEYVDDEYDF